MAEVRLREIHAVLPGCHMPPCASLRNIGLPVRSFDDSCDSPDRAAGGSKFVIAAADAKRAGSCDPALELPIGPVRERSEDEARFQNAEDLVAVGAG